MSEICLEGVNPSADLERILRWEQAGGEWRLLDEREGAITVALLRCDAGEEIERFTSRELDVRNHVSPGGTPTK